MAKLCIGLSLSALIISLSSRPNPPYVLPAPFAIYRVLGTPAWYSLPDASVHQANLSLRLGTSCISQYPTAANIILSGGGSRRRTSDPGEDFRRANCFENGTDYCGSDVRKLEDGTIRHPQACQHMCAQTPGCAYWTYVAETSSCYLKEKGALQGRTCTPSAISGPRTCLPTYVSCYEMDIDYYGSDEKVFVDHLVRSAEECHLLCLAFLACHFWTWVSAQRNCYLKNEHAPRGRLHAPGSVSGPRRCVATFPAASGGSYHQRCSDQTYYQDGCSDNNVLYTGTTIQDNAAVHGPIDCQCLCQQHPSCGGFSYLPTERRCILKPNQGTTIFQANAVSGPKYCHTPKCTIKDIEYYGRNIGNSSTSSFSVCHKLCQSSSRCSAVTFHEASKHCSLIQRAEYVRGFVSGPKWCASADSENNDRRGPATASGVAYVDSLGDSVCYDAGFAYTGKPFSAKHLHSADLCQRHCRADSRCKFFTYFLFAKTCLLHDNQGRRVLNETAASGPRVCPPSTPACFYEGVEVYGKDVGRCSTEDAAACQRKCRRNKQCSLFAYNRRSKLCSQRQHRGSASGTTSAPVFCGMPDDNVTLRHERPDAPETPDVGFTNEEHDKTSIPFAPPDVDRQPASPCGKPPIEMPVPCPSPDDEDGQISKPDVDVSSPAPSPDDATTAEKPNGDGVLPPKQPDENGKVPLRPRPPPAVPPEAECISVGFYSDGGAIQQSKVESSRKCQETCKQNEICSFFSFFRDSGDCVLHLSAGNRMMKQEAVSGPWKCGEEYRTPECLVLGEYEGTETTKTVRATARIYTTEDCFLLCRANEECKFFTYGIGSTSCTLFTSVSKIKSSTTAVSGPRSCSATSNNPCKQQGAACTGVQVATEDADSPADCLTKCQKHPSCDFYSHKTNEKSCSLLARDRTDKADDTAVCGAKYCFSFSFAPALLANDLVYTSDSKKLRAQSSSECYKLCEKDSTCRYFSYSRETKECRLHNRGGIRTREEGGQSGGLHPLKPVVVESCVSSRNASYIGEDFSTEDNVADFSKCKAKCRRKPQCRFYTYMTDDKTCTLFKSRRGITARRAAVSGWVECPDEKKCGRALSLDTQVYAVSTVSRLTAQRCELLCHLASSCTMWGRDKSTRTCFLSALFESAPQVVSGPLECNENVHPIWMSFLGGLMPQTSGHNFNSCFKDGYAYSSKPLDIPSASSIDASLESCQQTCQQHWNCQVFSFDTKLKTCKLFDAKKSLKRKQGCVSGPAWCTPPLLSCKVENVAVRGTSTMERKTLTLQQCVSLCASTVGSTYYMFDTVAKHCSCGYHQNESNERETAVKACMPSLEETMNKIKAQAGPAVPEGLQ